MASDIKFVEYVMEQINGIGTVSYKRMFGEFMVYVNQKPVIGICNNTAYVKILDCIKALCENDEKGFPYNGAKEHYILDIDNKNKVKKIVIELEKVIPIPKKRIKK